MSQWPEPVSKGHFSIFIAVDQIWQVANSEHVCSWTSPHQPSIFTLHFPPNCGSRGIWLSALRVACNTLSRDRHCPQLQPVVTTRKKVLTHSVLPTVTGVIKLCIIYDCLQHSPPSYTPLTIFLLTFCMFSRLSLITRPCVWTWSTLNAVPILLTKYDVF